MTAEIALDRTVSHADADPALAPENAPPMTAMAPSRWLPAVMLSWLGIYALLILMNIGGLSRGEFHDPDDQLRLQQVRDLIGGQGWFDLHQYRINSAGGGVLMHWSRLVDAPVAIVILMLRPLIGQANAELAALIIVPGVTLLAILALIGWISARVLPRFSLIFPLLALAFAAPVIVQVLPARIDHHGWQIALALAAIAAFLDSDARRGGWITGAALAGWMAISFEGLPLSAWFIAVLGLAALFDVEFRRRLVSAMQALAVTSLALFFATRGLADLAQHCDAIAPVHLAAFAWGACALTAVDRFAPRSRLALGVGLASAAAGALALIVSVAPQCTQGTFDMLDPVVRGFWLDKVQEGKPVFRSPLHLMVQFVLPPLLGLAATVWLAGHESGALRRWWMFYAAILAGALVIGVAVSRASAISGALAVIPLGWWLSTRLTTLKRPDNLLLRLGELVGAALLIFCTLLPVVPAAAIEKLTADGSKADDKDDAVRLACHTSLAGPALDALPGDGILAPMDLGPDILLNSRKSVLSSGHHRGARGMRLTIMAYSGTPAQARAIMADKGLRYVLLCPKLPEQALYLERAPNGFAAQLGRGEAPAWLKPVPMPRASQLKLWERLD